MTSIKWVSGYLHSDKFASVVSRSLIIANTQERSEPNGTKSRRNVFLDFVDNAFNV